MEAKKTMNLKWGMARKAQKQLEDVERLVGRLSKTNGSGDQAETAFDKLEGVLRSIR